MKLITLFFAVLFMQQPVTEFEAIKANAKSQHKLILLNFSGSDWCAPCILFKRDYLNSPEFAQLASKELIFVNADFPRKKKNQLSDALVKRNESLAERYNPQGHFPLTLLLDADGKILRKWDGMPEAPVAQWASEVSLATRRVH